MGQMSRGRVRSRYQRIVVYEFTIAQLDFCRAPNEILKKLVLGKKFNNLTIITF